MVELWKPIKGYEKTHFISSFGVIKTIKNGVESFINQTDSGGYKTACLTHNKVSKRVIVHRLVAEAFIPNLENKPVVNHMDKIRSNNRVENLEWVDYSENMFHKWKGIEKVVKAKKRRAGDPKIQMSLGIKESIVEKFGSMEAIKQAVTKFLNDFKK